MSNIKPYNLIYVDGGLTIYSLLIIFNIKRHHVGTPIEILIPIKRVTYCKFVELRSVNDVLTFQHQLKIVTKRSKYIIIIKHPFQLEPIYVVIKKTKKIFKRADIRWHINFL